MQIKLWMTWIGEQASLARQHRALDDIQQLIVILLRVNRQSEVLSNPRSIDLRKELDSVINKHCYLPDDRGAR